MQKCRDTDCAECYPKERLRSKYLSLVTEYYPYSRIARRFYSYLAGGANA